MKVEENPFSNTCRTCLIEKDTLSKIADSNITTENTTKFVFDLLNILTTIELKEKWPDSICLDCLGIVKAICKFKLQCEASNSYLENYFRKNDKNGQEFNQAALDTECKYEENVEFNPHHDNEFGDSLFGDRFECNICLQSFSTKRTWFQHKKSHNVKEPIVCTKCDESYTSLSLLRKHVREIHAQESLDHVDENIDSFIPHVCTKCNKTFKTKYILTVHEKRHKLKGHFLCPKCGKGFDSKGCLNRHMRVHTGEKKFECNVCNKKFPSNNNLKLHSRIHSGIKPYLCTVCGKSFSHPTGLTYHLKTHTKEKNFKCDICGKAFALQCHLDNHRKIHTGERPFQCQTCDKGFIKKVDLQRHEAVHTGSKPHICTICSKEFLRELHLHYHMMIHTEERPHKCSYCGKGFIRKYYLKDHVMKHHNVQIDGLNDAIS